MHESILNLHANGIDTVLVTVAASRGSTPAGAGAKLVATAGGLHSGTVGGGKIEARALDHALNLLRNPEAPPCELLTWNLQSDIGMTCGGEMTLLFETSRATPPWHIVIFGAGHIVQALVPILLTLPCRLSVIDTRRDWLDKLPTPGSSAGPGTLDTHHVGSHTEARSLVTPRSQVLSITQGHATDLPVLVAILRTHPDLPFVGVIGSRSKRVTLVRDLRENGIPASVIESLHCPLGLPVGDNSPAQIAISIAAQLIGKGS